MYDSPCHTANLEVTQVCTVLLLRLPGEFGGQELHRRHVRDQVVYVMLCEVSSENNVRLYIQSEYDVKGKRRTSSADHSG